MIIQHTRHYYYTYSYYMELNCKKTRPLFQLNHEYNNFDLKTEFKRDN